MTDPLRPPETDDEPWVILADGKRHPVTSLRLADDITEAEWRAFMRAIEERPDPALDRHRSRDIALACFAGLVILAILAWVTR